MAYTLFIYLPVAVCLFWLVVHTILASRNETFHEFICLCISCAVYLFADACHATQPKGSPLDTGALIASLFFGPCIIPLIIMYTRKLMHKRQRHQFALLWVVIPTILFTGGFLLYFLNFDERINQAFALITGPIFHLVLAAELLLLVVFCLSTLRYSRILPGNVFLFFRGKKISLPRLQIYTISPPLLIMVLRIIISDNLYTAKPWMAITSALVIMVSLYIFGLNALYGMRSKVSWHDFRYLIRFNYSVSDKADVLETIMDEILEEADEESLKRIQEKIGESLNPEEGKSGEKGLETPQLAESLFKEVSDSTDNLVVRFQSLMKEKELFLQPKLTLDDLADELNTNKTYVSKMVNNTYNMGFPELVNTLRVEHAKQYVLSHRDAKQEEIAANCGFLSASSFNTVFKKVTGVTPKVWIASNR